MERTLEAWEWCAPCKVSFTSERAAKNHLRSKRHLQNSDQQLHWQAACTQCGKLFGRDSDRQRHERKQQCRRRSRTPDVFTPTSSDQAHGRSDVAESDWLSIAADISRMKDSLLEEPVAATGAEVLTGEISSHGEQPSPLNGTKESNTLQAFRDVDTSPPEHGELVQGYAFQSKPGRLSPNDSRHLVRSNILQLLETSSEDDHQLKLNTALCLAIKAQDDQATHSLLGLGAEAAFPAEDYLALARSYPEIRPDDRILSPLTLALWTRSGASIETLCRHGVRLKDELYGTYPGIQRYESYKLFVETAFQDLSVFKLLLRLGLLEDDNSWQLFLYNIVCATVNDYHACELVSRHGSSRDFQVNEVLLLQEIGRIINEGRERMVAALLPLQLSSMFGKVAGSEYSLLEITALRLELNGSCFVHSAPTKHPEILQLLLKSRNQKWSLTALRNSLFIVLQIQISSEACQRQVESGGGAGRQLTCALADGVLRKSEKLRAMENLDSIVQLIREQLSAAEGAGSS